MVHNKAILTPILKGSIEMKTKDQIKREFMKDLKVLLEKYDARVSAESFNHFPYVEVSIPAVWDDDGNIMTPSVDIDLGPYIDKSDF